MFWDKDKVSTTDSGVTIKTIREDRPKFKREYSAKLDDGRSIKITIYNSSGLIFKNGELTQRNGKWVLFDPDRVAEKILDPVLVPKINERIREIFALDRAFRHNNPGQFTDEAGTVWQRV